MTGKEGGDWRVMPANTFIIQQIYDPIKCDLSAHVYEITCSRVLS